MQNSTQEEQTHTIVAERSVTPTGFDDMLNMATDIEAQLGASGQYVAWTADTDKFARRTSKEIITYMERHKLAAQYFKKRNDIFQVSLICISGVSSIITVIPDDATADPWSPLKLTVKLMTPVVTLLTVLNKYFNFGQIMEQHLNAVKAFRELLSMLQTQLVLPLEDRIPASRFIPAIMKQLSKNMNEYPDIPLAIRKIEITVPEETEEIVKIHEERSLDFQIDPLTQLELAEINNGAATNVVKRTLSMSGPSTSRRSSFDETT